MHADVVSPSVLTAGARILRADNGSEIALSDLAVTGKRPMVWTLNERGRLAPGAMGVVSQSGSREVFELRLASGRTIEASSATRFHTVDGWKPLRGLQIDDRMAVPRRIPRPITSQKMVDAEVILLAHMIGDGSCVRNQPIRYASIDENNLRAVANAAKHFGVSAVRDDYPAARVTTLRLPAPYRLARGRRNPIAVWLDGLGLFGLRSYDKFVPAEVFAAPNDQVALFLRHLWATDGSVWWDAKRRKGTVYYGSTSRRLIDDVMQLLLRFGVYSRAYRASKAGYRDCWQLHISGVDNQRRFLRNIDVHGERSREVIQVLVGLAGVQSNENVDTVPREVWDRVRQCLSEQQMSQRAFAVAMQIKFCGSAMWKPSPSRGRLHKAAVILNDRILHDLSNNDVFWDRIVKITSIGGREVYEVTADGANNIVAQGVSVAIDIPELGVSS